MIAILNAVIVLMVIGAAAALLLVVASKYMSVPVDEKFPKIRECLPGANCGACGFAGCDGYAQALADGSETRTNLCVPGADKVARDLSEVMGTPFEDVVEQVAFVHCMGDCNIAKIKYDYEGIESCAAANLMYNGRYACIHGCLGLGDCVKACPNNALRIKDGIAVVNPRLCTGCGICTRTCPNHLVRLMPDVNQVVNTCSNIEKGAVARQQCKNACIGCKMCEKNCPEGAIKVENNLAVIDYEKCINCGKCASVCPTGCLKIYDLSGVHRYVKAE